MSGPDRALQRLSEGHGHGVHPRALDWDWSPSTVTVIRLVLLSAAIVSRARI